MNIPPEIKEGMRIIFSDAENKPYIGQLLAFINPEETLLPDRAIEILNSGMR